MPQQITDDNIGAFEQLYENYKVNPTFYDGHPQQAEVINAVKIYQAHLNTQSTPPGKIDSQQDFTPNENYMPTYKPEPVQEIENTADLPNGMSETVKKSVGRDLLTPETAKIYDAAQPKDDLATQEPTDERISYRIPTEQIPEMVPSVSKRYKEALLAYQTTPYAAEYMQGLLGDYAGIDPTELPPPNSILEKVGRQGAGLAGTVLSFALPGAIIKKFGLMKVLAKSPKFIEWSARMSRGAKTLSKPIVQRLLTQVQTFVLHGQIQTKGWEGRFERIPDDAITGMVFGAIGQLGEMGKVGNIAAYPSMFGAGYGMAKAGGATNEDAIISGSLLFFLHAGGKLMNSGEKKAEPSTKPSPDDINAGLDRAGMGVEPKRELLFKELIKNGIEPETAKTVVNDALMRAEKFRKDNPEEYKRLQETFDSFTKEAPEDFPEELSREKLEASKTDGEKTTEKPKPTKTDTKTEQIQAEFSESKETELPGNKILKPTKPTEPTKTIEKPTEKIETGKKHTTKVYRGTKEGKPPTDDGLYGKGTYYSTNKKYAETYGKVEESDVTLKNPFVINNQKEATEFFNEVTKPARDKALADGKSIQEADQIAATAAREHLESKGYDGVIARDIIEKGDEVVVFAKKPAESAPKTPKKEPSATKTLKTDKKIATGKVGGLRNEIRHIGRAKYTITDDKIMKRDRFGNEYPISQAEFEKKLSQSAAGIKATRTKAQNTEMASEKDLEDMPATRAMRGMDFGGDNPELDYYRIGNNPAFAEKAFHNTKGKGNSDTVEEGALADVVNKYGYGAVHDRDGNIDINKITELIENEFINAREKVSSKEIERAYREADELYDEPEYKAEFEKITEKESDEFFKFLEETNEGKVNEKSIKSDKTESGKPTAEPTEGVPRQVEIPSAKSTDPQKTEAGRVDKTLSDAARKAQHPDREAHLAELKSAKKYLKDLNRDLKIAERNKFNTKGIKEEIAFTEKEILRLETTKATVEKAVKQQIDISEQPINYQDTAKQIYEKAEHFNFDALDKNLRVEGEKAGINQKNIIKKWQQYIENPKQLTKAARQFIEKVIDSVKSFLEKAKDESGFIINPLKAKKIEPKKIEKPKGKQVATVEALKATREKFHFGDMPLDEVERWVDVFKEGEKRVDNAQYIAQGIIKKPRVLSREEFSALALRERQLEDIVGESVKDAADAIDRGNMMERDRLVANRNGALGELNQVVDAMRLHSRETGRSLNIIRVGLAKEGENYKVAKVLQHAKVAKGEKLTEKEIAEFSDLSKKIEELTAKETKLAKEVEQLQERLSRQDADGEFKKTSRTVKRERSQTTLKSERTDLFNQLDKLGYRLNDVTGLTYETATIVSKLAKNYVESGIKTLDGITEKIQTKVPDLSKKDIYDSIGGRIKSTKKRVVSETTKELNEIKKQARLMGKIEDAYDGIFENGKVRDKPSVKVAELQKELSELKKVATQSIRDDATLQRIVERIDNAKEQIRTGVRDIAKDKKIESPEIKLAREELSELRKLLRVKDQIADLENQLETGDFKIPVRVQRVTKSADLLEAQVKLSQLKRDVRERIHALRPRTTTDLAIDVWTLPRTLMATGELSGIARQGMLLSTSHPIKTLKILPKSMKSFISDHTAAEIDVMLKQRPQYQTAKNAGLFESPLDNSKLTPSEEMFYSSLGEKIPIWGRMVKASSRQMSTHLNLMRAIRFDSFLDRNPNATNLELRAWADFVNIASGRGNLGKAEGAAEVLSLPFFSLRLFLSRIQYPFQVFKNLKHPNVRKEIAKSYLADLATFATVLEMMHLAGADVGLDPTTSDFLKIRVGNTRADIFAGLQQPMRVGILAFMQAADTYGLIDLKKNQDLYNSINRFINYKASPGITVPFELIQGKTIIGEKRTPIETILNSMQPLAYDDIIEAYRNNPLIGMAVAPLAILGVGLNTYRDTDQDWNKGNASIEIKNLKYKIGAKKFEEANERYNETVSKFFNAMERTDIYKAMSDEKQKEALSKLRARVKQQVLDHYNK